MGRVERQSKQDVIQCLWGVASWLVVLVRRASWATGFAGLMGAATYEFAVRLKCQSLTVCLGTVGAISVGACIGRSVDLRLLNRRQTSNPSVRFAAGHS